MKQFYILFLAIGMFIPPELSIAQLLRLDDFQYKNNYWYWRSDGNQSKPITEDGLLKLQLKDAINTEYCNTEIYDPDEYYLPGTQARIRLKTSKIHNGSRG